MAYDTCLLSNTKTPRMAPANSTSDASTAVIVAAADFVNNDYYDDDLTN